MRFSMPTAVGVPQFAKALGIQTSGLTPNSSNSQGGLSPLGQDTVSLKFGAAAKKAAGPSPASITSSATAGKKIDPGPFMPKDSDYEYQNLESQSMLAARICLKGVETHPQDLELGKQFLTQSMVSSNPEKDQDYAKSNRLVVAKMLIQGYYALEKNPEEALKLLNPIIAEGVSGDLTDKSDIYYSAEAAMMKIQYLSDQLAPGERASTIQTLKKLLAKGEDNRLMTISAARFFAKVLNQQDDAIQLAYQAEAKIDQWNQEYEAERDHRNLVDTSSAPLKSTGTLGAREMMDLIQDIAKGQNGFTQNIKAASQLLNSLVNRIETPNPVYQKMGAELFAQVLGQPERASELVNEILTQAKYPPYLATVAIIARDLKDAPRARQMLEAAEADPKLLRERSGKLSPEIKIEMAEIYGKYIGDFDKANQLLNSFQVDDVSDHHRSELYTQMAYLYAKNLGDPVKAEACLDEAQKVADRGGSGNPQKIRLLVATAYLDTVNQQEKALGLLKETVSIANKYFSPIPDMQQVKVLLDRFTPDFPGVDQLKSEAEAVIQQDRLKNDHYQAYD
ncbi:MAG: hypothetical protein K2X66_06505 [Cyanobacteria bacterium]|nr:hypothetical protein [Cyanobacteriota bacterium]